MLEHSTILLISVWRSQASLVCVQGRERSLVCALQVTATEKETATRQPSKGRIPASQCVERWDGCHTLQIQ